MLALFAAFFILSFIFLTYYLFIFEKPRQEQSWNKKLIVLALAWICMVMTYPALLAQTQSTTTYAGYNVISSSNTAVSVQNVTTTYDSRLSVGVFHTYLPFYVAMWLILILLTYLLVIGWHYDTVKIALGDDA